MTDFNKATNINFKFTINEIVGGLCRREFTATDIILSFIERVKKVESLVHAWASFDENYVLSQAEQIDRIIKENLSVKVLSGVPIGIKDIFNTYHYPTEKGTPIWKDYKAGNDARCISYLRDNQGIIFGKTNTAELAVHANPKEHNPYNLLHVAGTSSGGSAAAVATAMVPVALGTQTGGSIIRPASWCGVYAMKPSFGLIPRTGVLKTTDTLDNIGFFTRCISDLEIILDVLRVHGENFPIQEERLNLFKQQKKKKWRLGYCSTTILNDTESYVINVMIALKQNISSLSNIEIVDLALPSAIDNCFDLHRRIYHSCLVYYLKNEIRKNFDEISPTLKSIFLDGESIPPDDYVKALLEQEQLAHNLETFFIDHKLDAIIFNSSNGSAPIEKEPTKHLDLNALWTMAWLPVINIPQFKCKKGLPFGFQIIGPRYSDYKLIDLLKYFEREQLIPNYTEIVTPTKNITINNTISKEELY